MNSELSKIFVGCKRPSKIDDYIRGVRNGTKVKMLKEIKQDIMGLYDEDDPQERKDAIFDMLNILVPKIVELEKEAESETNNTR